MEEAFKSNRKFKEDAVFGSTYNYEVQMQCLEVYRDLEKLDISLVTFKLVMLLESLN